MRLTALRLHDVRRFVDRGVAIEGIDRGVNVLCAANEYGKSTCFDALQALFFLSHASEAAAVQALRPYSGGQPWIEADIVTETGRFRLGKQFAGRRRAIVTDLATGRIVAQAGEAEDFIAGLVRTGPGGPAGLLWVRQGSTGLDRRQRDEDGERRAREGVLSSVRGEVEALTGGRRMSEAIRSCEDDLARLVTPKGRAKAGGAYAAALAERDRLAAEEAKLQGEVDILRAALDRRRAARRRLADVTAPEEDTSRREALRRAELDHFEAKAGQDAAAAADAEAKRLADRRHAAAAASEAYRGALDGVEAVESRHEEASRRRDEIAERRHEAARLGEATQAAVTAAEREEADAKALLARLDRAMRARQDAERRSEVEATLARAREARDEIERLEALARTLAIPAGELASLGRLEAEIAGMRTALAVRSASLTMTYGPEATGRVSLDGVPLAADEERMLPATAEVEIDGIGTLTLRTPFAIDEARRLEAAEGDLAARLEVLGVVSVAAAHVRDAAFRDRRLELEVARQRLALLAPGGIALLQEECARLGRDGSTPEDVVGDPEAARSQFLAAEQRALLARTAEREAWPGRRKADDDLIAAEAALAKLAAERIALDAVLGPAEERAGRRLAREQDLAEATEAAEAARRRCETLKDAVTLLPRAEAALRRARSVVEAADTEASRLREEIADLSGQIRARSEDGVDEALAEVAESHRAAAAHAERVAGEVAVLTRLREALEAARAAAREHYFEPVMRELTPLLGLVFDDASVVFDDATLLPRQVRRNGLEEPVGALSGGAREQLAVLTRLAFGRLLAREGHPAPVILDDALVYSDDERIERMFDVLHRQADEQQIIVFSCRQRAFARLGGTVLQMTPWRPPE